MLAGVIVAVRYPFRWLHRHGDALAPDLGRHPARGTPPPPNPASLGTRPRSMAEDDAGSRVRSHRATHGRMSSTTLKERGVG